MRTAGRGATPPVDDRLAAYREALARPNRPLTLTATRVHSYFARHAVDKEGKSHEWGSDEDPSAGYIAWLLWGGEEGKVWVDRHAAKLS